MRKTSIDLGVNIRFYGLSELKSRRPARKAVVDSAPSGNPDQPFHAIGVIDYPAADGGGEEGIVLYVKAGYHEHRIFNAGVRHYATTNPDFPHETTGDQFFSESQFESYRALAFEIMDDLVTRAIGLTTDPACPNPTLPGVLTALRTEAEKAGVP